MSPEPTPIPPAPALKLPPSLQPEYEQAGNGELLWRRPAALEFIEWLREQNIAIVGGEVYARHMWARFSFRRDWITMPPQGPDEAWDDFVTRAAQQARASIEPHPEDGPGDIRYFFATSERQSKDRD